MGKFSAQHLQHFRDEGYVVVEDLIDSKSVLEPLEAEYCMVLDNLARKLFDEGLITSTYDEMGFGERLIQIYQESEKVHSQYFDFSLPQKNVTYDTPMWHGPAVFNVLTATDLLKAVEAIIGPEIYSNPTQHTRLKPPEYLTPTDPDTGHVQLGETPWHQDNGVLTEDADKTDVLTVWIPVWDVDEKVGCLQLVPRSFQEGLNQHCPGLTGGVRIPDQMFRVNDAVPIPMRRGSVLFMHRLTCHGSLPNRSDHIRWSLDLRYNPIGQSTGRDAFPGFVAQSKDNPETELHEAETWAQQWRDARNFLSRQNDPSYNRWDSNDPACA